MLDLMAVIALGMGLGLGIALGKALGKALAALIARTIATTAETIRSAGREDQGLAPDHEARHDHPGDP